MLKPILQPQQPPSRTILTVSQLNQKSKQLLEENLGAIWLTGEISNFTQAASGHWYFSLKDSQAQISCAMFRFKTQNLNFAPAEGDKVVVKGKVSLYEARGNYQLIADYMEPAGLGDLQQRLNQLTTKLSAEGLFASEHKRDLPFLPRAIGVITSPTGAAVHDVLTVLRRRCPMIPVIIYPTQVQGASAVEQIIKALELAESRAECDVLLITRGGGSLEDLWCFNDEMLARKIFNAKLPIVAAIGHEVDTTITELVADLRAPTPSAAAELVAPEQIALQQRLDLLALSLNDVLIEKIDLLQVRLNFARLKLADPQTAIANSRHRLNDLFQRLMFHKYQLLSQFQHQLEQLSSNLHAQQPKRKIERYQQQLANLSKRLAAGWQLQYENHKHQLQLKARALNTLSPLSTLERGYSIAREPETGKVFCSAKQLSAAQQFRLMLSDGYADAVVEKVVIN